jgi:hypothetical protein
MAITSIEARPISPLEMKKKVCQQIKGTSKHSKELGPKSLLNTRMKVESKKVI